MITPINRLQFGTNVVPRPQRITAVVQKQLDTTVHNFQHIAGSSTQHANHAVVMASSLNTPDGTPKYQIQVSAAQQGKPAQARIAQWCEGEENWNELYSMNATPSTKAPEVHDLKHDVTLEGKSAKTLLSTVQPWIDQAVQLRK